MSYAPTSLWTAWAVSSSIVIHALVYLGLGSSSASPRPRPPKSVVAFEVAQVPPVQEPPKLPEPEPKAPEPRLPAKPAPVAQAPAETVKPARPAEAAPIDMSGLTLTNDLGTGFAMPAGNGLAREGALRVPASLSREKPAAAGSERPVAEGPTLVALKDLSSRPAPPALDGALERNYPAEARSRGLGGSATVRVRIDSDGVVRNVSALNESSSGFGEACRRTLRGSRWSAPRDQTGRPVATEVRYTCRFVVNP